MTTCRILYATLSFLAVNIGICPYVVAASTLQMTETSQEISGTDSDSGVSFRASLLVGGHVIVDLYIGSKRIHEEVDYTRQAFKVRVVSQATETPVALSVQDILAVQKLRDSRFSPPPKTHTSNTSGRLRDTLGRLLNLISDAPPGAVIDITTGPSLLSYTSICPQIGGPGLATYTLGTSGETRHDDVTVGPVCFQDPARGRCGAVGGPDPIGHSQPFTQECLNHDVCCDKTKGSPPFCGSDCFPAFLAAAAGYALAPDCGNTGGDWIDSNGEIYGLSNAESNGPPEPFAGYLNNADAFCARDPWLVTGTRTGLTISFTATNPSPPNFLAHCRRIPLAALMPRFLASTRPPPIMAATRRTARGVMPLGKVEIGIGRG